MRSSIFPSAINKKAPQICRFAGPQYCTYLAGIVWEDRKTYEIDRLLLPKLMRSIPRQ